MRKMGFSGFRCKRCKNWCRGYPVTLQIAAERLRYRQGPKLQVSSGTRLAVCLALLIAVFATAGADWLHFRGTDSTSVSNETNLPRSFSEKEHVAWKSPLPGSGPSGPIVVAGRIIVTAASGPRQDRLHVMALDAANGRIRWERRFWASGHTIHNAFGGVAAPTPASDGRQIFALFSSNDLACFDLDGNLQWFRGLALESPTTRNDVGMASSPLVVDDTVIAQLEGTGGAFLTGIDTATGETRWKIDRPSEPTWTSPVLLPGKTPAEATVLIQSRLRLTAHQPRTGKQIWSYEAPCSTLSSLTVEGGDIFLPAGAGLCCLRPDAAAGGVKLLWEDRRLRCENESPVAHAGRVYTIKSPAILVCGDAASGKVLWQLRLKGAIWATPVLVDGHLYVVNHEGLVQVVHLGEEGAVVGTGQLDSGILASAAVADGGIYFRSNRWLWKIAGSGTH